MCILKKIREKVQAAIAALKREIKLPSEENLEGTEVKSTITIPFQVTPSPHVIRKEEQAWVEKVTMVECPHCKRWISPTKPIRTLKLRMCKKHNTIFTDKCPHCNSSGMKFQEVTLFECPKCKREVSKFGKEWFPLVQKG